MSKQESWSTAGRPVPNLPAPNDAATANEPQLDTDSDHDHSASGRRHAPATVSKMSFTSNTPASKMRALQKLTQSLTFSDQSSHSSAASTPHKESGQASTHSLQGSTHSAPPTFAARPAVATKYTPGARGDEGEGPEYVSEGEASTGISIGAIISKLDQVKSYLQEAESLHMQMKQKLSEPGMMAQVSKVGKLVEDLRRQESGYLNILLKLLDQQGNVNPSQVGTGGLESEEASEDGGGSEGEMPSEALEGDEEEEERDGEANDSMSLKAELLKKQMAAHRAEAEEQEDELRMLRQQRDLLRKLLEQQKQIEDLEARQKGLLEQKSDAEVVLASTAAKVQPTAAVPSQEKPARPKEKPRVVNENDETASTVADKLQQVRERQARVQQLTSLLSQLRTQTEEETESHLPNAGNGSTEAVGGTTTTQPQGRSGSSELVAVGDQAMPAALVELHQKLKQAEEARAKLTELQGMLSLLQEVEGGRSPVRDQVRETVEPASRQGMGDSERDQQQREDHSHSEGELERSVLSEYEERLAQRRWEVGELQQQREKLLATQRKLQELQHNMSSSVPVHVPPSSKKPPESPKHSEDGPGAGQELSSQLASELGRQRRLYDDLLDKTQQIQSMVDEVAGARDVTAATWGGSSVPSSDEEEEDGVESTASVPGGTGGLDDTREDLEHTYTAVLGDSAAMVGVPGGGNMQPGGGKRERGEEGEGVVFRVTRHTPRTVHGGPKGGHRRTLTPEGSPHSAGKRMKLDVSSSPVTTDNLKGAQSAPFSAAVPAMGSYCAAWPGVIFPPTSRKHTREEATQTAAELANNSDGSIPPSSSLTNEHISLLHHQLGVTSSMASQLAFSQHGLISAMCRQLESLQLEERIQDHFTRLHQYQAELEQYYQELQNVYFKPRTADEADLHPPHHQQGGDEEEEEAVVRDQEEPIFQRCLSPQPPFTSTAVPPSSGANDSATAGYAPYDPRAGLAEANLNRQQSEAFTHQTAGSAFQQVPSMPSFPQGTHGSNVPSRRTSQGLPPAPTAYFPHVYQHQCPVDEKEGGGEPDVNAQMEGSFAPAPPPPPLAPYLQQPSPYTPYHHPHSWVPPTPFPTMPHTHHAFGLPHPPLLRPSLGGFMSASQRFPSYHTPYSRYRLSWPPAHLPGVSPVYPGYYGSVYDPAAAAGAESGVPTGYGLNSSHHMFRSSYPPHVGYGDEAGTMGGGGVRGQRLYSPSGVTGISMQVQPPSSPPSAPSLSNLQQTSSMMQPTSGSGLLHQSSSSTLQAPSTTTSHNLPSQPATASTSLPPLTSTVTTSNTVPLPTHSTSASHEWRERGEEGRREGDKEGERPPATNSHVHTHDQESLSSMPLSLPDTSREDGGEGGEGAVGKPPEDFSVFDALRDTIYSEVATLIANNENRPHFLVELFRELQMLSSDYLRQRALYSLQDLVTRYLTEESLQQRRCREDAAANLQAWVGSEPTPSESLVTSDEEVVRAKPPTAAGGSGGGGGGVGEPAELSEGSPRSTPPPPPQSNDTPFATDNLGDTVVRLDKAMARLRESYVSPGRMQPPVISPGPLATSADLSQSSQSESMQNAADINAEQLDEQIKTIMTEVIPLLKEHMTTSCSSELLQQIRQLVMCLVLAQLKEQNSSIVETFSKQLDTTLHATLLKYLNKMLKECGEALLVEVSEVLFNELAFFRLMQTMGVPKESDFKSMTSHSQTTTENEAEEEEEEERGGEPVKEREMGGYLPILQSLRAAVANTLSDEQEALGKSRDDEFAKEFKPLQDRPSSPSVDEEQTFTVELSASESKPIQSVGSDEGDTEEGSLLQQQQQHVTGSGTEEKVASASAQPAGEREETPPTPVIIAASTVPTLGGTQGTAAAGAQTAQSPPPEPANAALEVQRKAEQQSTEGIAGILATIEQGQELAGDSDQLPQPSSSETVAEP